jgi:hypothetical protein
MPSHTQHHMRLPLPSQGAHTAEWEQDITWGSDGEQAAAAHAEAEAESEGMEVMMDLTDGAAAGGASESRMLAAAAADAAPQRWRLPVPAALEAFGSGAAAGGGGRAASSMHAQMLRLEQTVPPAGAAAADGAAAAGADQGAGDALPGTEPGPRLHARTQQVHQSTCFAHAFSPVRSLQLEVAWTDGAVLESERDA